MLIESVSFLLLFFSLILSPSKCMEFTLIPADQTACNILTNVQSFTFSLFFCYSHFAHFTLYASLIHSFVYFVLCSLLL